ncbi:Flp pilus assembly protein CpaB [Celeribacter halophilus]|uniref:Flp pilus assembly protein CpaB n=1 Tax=Celeribacter halophilus TaxID=576117 RepID=UPI003A927537
MFIPVGLFGRIGAVLTVSALVAGSVMWFGLRQEDQAASQPAPVQAAVKIASDRVLVAAAELSIGAPISDDGIISVEMPETQIAESFLRDTLANREALLRLTAVRMVPGGTPFVSSDLIVPEVPDIPAPVQTSMLHLSEGMRAISLPVTEATSVAGLVRNGDRVDVMLSYKAENNALAIRTVLRNVRIIATDQVAEPTDGSEQKPLKASPKIVTFELPPDGAKVLALAQKMGDLMLVLSDGTEGDDPIIAKDTPIFASQVSGGAEHSEPAAPSRSVSVVRGTQTQVNVLTVADADVGALEALTAAAAGAGAHVTQTPTPEN